MARGKSNVLEIARGADAKQPGDRSVVISPPKFEMAQIRIVGTAPYCQHRFSTKARNQIIQTQEAGSQARKGKQREAKDFNEVYLNAMYKPEGGGYGLPASSFRNAMISACRVVGFRMTLAKLSLFVVADCHDAEDATPLVRITKGEPFPHTAPARNANGSIDIRCRPMWHPGWEATITAKWDAGQFSAGDVANLLSRVGQQIGIGEGRPDSRMSSGLGWGLFDLVN